MLTGNFAYHRPKTLAEASKLAATLGAEACYLAGGTDLVPDFKRGSDSARHVISLRDVPGLGEIRESGEDLRVGAMARIEEVARSSAVRRRFPVLAEAASRIGAIQVRSQGTIGGNFCRAVPCADTPPPCLVGNARVRLSGAGKERELPAEEFFTGPRQTVLGPGELLLEIVVPAQPEGSGASYQRFALRKGSALAVASVAARLVLAGDEIIDARVALGAVAPVPLLARECARGLTGGRVSEELFARAARTAAAESRPISDIRGSEAFRRELVEVLTRRALSHAAARARGEKGKS
jgi:carbon-monoxide dehydrogenase medium subunit